MIRIACVATLVLSSVALTAGFAAEAPETALISLKRLKAKEAVTTLRAIAEVRDLEIVDEHTIRITEAAGTIEIARAAIAMAERPDEVAEEIPTHSVADGSVIASVRLRRTSPPKVLMALRRELGIRRISTHYDVPTIIVRDAPDKVAAALDLIRQMEAEPSQNES
jgi:hypothetical protein